jgi:hypothetical protein
MKIKREGVVANLKSLQKECEPILKVLENQQLVKQLRVDKQFTFKHLSENFGVSNHSNNGIVIIS